MKFAEIMSKPNKPVKGPHHPLAVLSWFELRLSSVSGVPLTVTLGADVVQMISRIRGKYNQDVSLPVDANKFATNPVQPV